MARVCLLILDGVGVGEAPDAADYGDQGANSVANTAAAVGGLRLPELERMGFGNIVSAQGVASVTQPTAAWGRMRERSPGKDTTTGHWEISGVILDKPFPVYPSGFPSVVINAFSAAVGRPVLGNKPASGTAIIEELGPEHLRTGYPIVYTSADSVFQIAAHESVIPVPELYRYCEIARELLQGEHGVGRVIARPFTGSPGAFVRTADRRDFSLPPPRPTVLDTLVAAGWPVYAVGKICDIFAHRGITESFPAHTNEESVDATVQCLRRKTEGLIFANLIEFDMLWGHRNDPRGYARALEQFDARLPEIVAALTPRDLLIITADHGVDPTTPGTDHTRELVPLIAYRPGMIGSDLGTRDTFADVAATIAEVFGVPGPPVGTSFLSRLQ